MDNLNMNAMHIDLILNGKALVADVPLAQVYAIVARLSARFAHVEVSSQDYTAAGLPNRAVVYVTCI